MFKPSLPFALTLTFLCTTLFAGDGADLTLTVTPDEPLSGGETVSVNLSDGELGSLALLFGGDELGSFPLGDITLDLNPTIVVPLGFVGPDGSVGADVTLPDELPPEISGLVIHLQAITVGIDFDGDPPSIEFRKSNLDSVSFE